MGSNRAIITLEPHVDVLEDANNTGGYFRMAIRNKHRFYDLIRGIFT